MQPPRVVFSAHASIDNFPLSLITFQRVTGTKSQIGNSSNVLSGSLIVPATYINNSELRSIRVHDGLLNIVTVKGQSRVDREIRRKIEIRMELLVVSDVYPLSQPVFFHARPVMIMSFGFERL